MYRRRGCLARFKVPLELGIAMASRYLARSMADRHDWLVMVPTRHQYGRFISDLAGFDPVTHNGTDRGLVVAVMTWLATRPDAAGTLSPQQVLKGLPRLRRELRTLRKTWGHWPHGPTWSSPPSRSQNNSGDNQPSATGESGTLKTLHAGHCNRPVPTPGTVGGWWNGGSL
jgi:hypothetical protein